MTLYKNSFKIFLISVLLTITGFFILTDLHKRENISYSYNLFHTTTGWGYDILVNKKLFIHQDVIPSAISGKAFDTPVQAKNAAQIVIQNMLKRRSPSLNQYQIDQITGTRQH